MFPEYSREFHGIAGAFKGVSAGSRGFQEVPGAFQGCSKDIKGFHKYSLWDFREFERHFKGILENFKRFQERYRGSREF